jgi:hypothetical protein
VITKADDFRERGTIVARRFDATNFSDCSERAVRFDDEADQLRHAAAILDRLRFAGAFEQMGNSICSESGHIN